MKYAALTAMAVFFYMTAAALYAEEQTFYMNMSVYRPIAVDVVQDLVFEDVKANGSDQKIVVIPGGKGSAVLKSIALPNASFVASVVPQRVEMLGSSVFIDDFVVLGSGTYNDRGVESIAIGATATVKAAAKKGSYSATVPVRVAYQ